MTKLAILLLSLILVSGCTAESIKIAVDCTEQRAVATQEALREVARISASQPLPAEVAEPIRRAYEAASGINRWTSLMKKDVGVVESPPVAMTSEEIAQQGLYQSRIDMKNALKEAIPLPLPTGGGGIPWTNHAGKGVFGIATTVLGVLLKRKMGQARVAKEAAKEALEVIASSNDAELKKRAAEKPNLTREYADKKLSDYNLRIQTLENS